MNTKLSLDNLGELILDAESEKDPSVRVRKCREVLVLASEFIFIDGLKRAVPSNVSLYEILNDSQFVSYVANKEILRGLDYVRILGINAEHGKVVRKTEANLAVENMKTFFGFLQAKDSADLSSFVPLPYMSEAATRKLYVDTYLGEAGWEVLESENLIQPGKAGIEIEVQGMPNEHGIGYCDYVLYGRDGKPLAIVEAKRTSKNESEGRHQVDLYGECMKAVYGYKPVLYYTNGYKIKIIDGLYPDREVRGFHKLEELELLIQRRSRNDITDLSIDDNITNRPYQKIAITSICERFNSRQRRGLLVMATGTGKTRVAISIVDVLARNRWVKNILFLADRTALVDQAKKNFVKLLPNMSVCVLSEDREKDFDARIIFSTYQTMINYIDAEDKQFSIGRFDLIIIDEAHRSVFNKYGSIFRYFDSLLIGLTATPKDEVDSNTYSLFDCESGEPNFNYSLKEAVDDHYLVGYKVDSRTSKLISRGIEYNKLSAEEKEQLEEYIDEEPPELIPGTEIFKKLYNEHTCNLVLEDLMTRGLRVNNGETLGKSIIFAYNHRHAELIVDCFRKQYPEYPANTCQLVDYSVNYAKDLVVKFEENDEFRIAVSVDMLDTGVDVPAVLNLVFFKPVKSKIKFVQMIGRGTRLCENVFGTGMDKEGFKIFDYCGNFEYFSEHPDGAADKGSKTLSQRLFELKLDILYELQKFEYQQDEACRAYYLQLKDWLHGQIVLIREHRNRIQVRDEMQLVDKYYDMEMWTNLSLVNVKEIKTHLVKLLDSGLQGQPMALAFDAKMLNIELGYLVRGTLDTVGKDVKTVMKIANYLLNEKASIPSVMSKADTLRLVTTPQFWESPSVDRLEKVREELRDLMQFLTGDNKPELTVNIRDLVEDSGFSVEGTDFDIRTYKEKVIDYLAEHSDSPVIQKILNLEAIDISDLRELERILWNELGTREQYAATTDQDNLAAFIRSLVGLNQEAVNEKFGQYLSGNRFNSQQQEFIKTIISYVRENGDITKSDLVNNEPFSNFDLNELFGVAIPTIVDIINVLHGSIMVA